VLPWPDFQGSCHLILQGVPRGTPPSVCRVQCPSLLPPSSTQSSALFVFPLTSAAFVACEPSPHPTAQVVLPLGRFARRSCLPRVSVGEGKLRDRAEQAAGAAGGTVLGGGKGSGTRGSWSRAGVPRSLLELVLEPTALVSRPRRELVQDPAEAGAGAQSGDSCSCIGSVMPEIA